LVMSIVLLGLCATLITGLFRISFTVKEKIRLQVAADNAILSALSVQANALNTIAIGNRAIISNDSFIAGMNATASEISFYRKLAENFSRILRFIPNLGPLMAAGLTRGGRALELTVQRIASFIIPTLSIINRTLHREQNLIIAATPLLTWKVTSKTLEKCAPGSRLSSVSKAILLNKAAAFRKNFTKLDIPESQRLLEETIRGRTISRNWKSKIGGISLPVRKTGGTYFRKDDFHAFDNLRFRVFSRFRWRWKTVLSSNSNASKFGYQGQAALKTISDEYQPISLSIAVHSSKETDKNPLLGTNKTLTAVSAGELYYLRKSRPEENRNLFNPFWKSRLMPVALETSAKKFIPQILLKEVHH